MWFNNIVRPMLKSPLHFLMSGSTMLVTYTGRKSGTEITVPVNYVQVGDTLLTISQPDRVWWKNLRDGKPVHLLIKGKTYEAIPTVAEDTATVEPMLLALVQASPAFRRYFKVEVLEDGNVSDPEVIRRESSQRVVIRFALTAD